MSLNIELEGNLFMKIVIHIDGWTKENTKEIVNSIRGFAKSLAKRFGFQMEFECMEG